MKKSLISAITCLALVCNHTKAQIVIEEMVEQQPQYEVLNTDSVDLHKFDSSDEKKYGMSILELYKQYIGQRFLLYSDDNNSDPNFSFKAYTPNRQFIAMPTPVNIEFFSQNKTSLKVKSRGTFRINRISTYRYNPHAFYEGEEDYRGPKALGTDIAYFVDQKRKHEYFFKLPNNLVIQCPFTVQYVTLKDVIFNNGNISQLFTDSLIEADGTSLYKSVIDEKEYFSKDVKDDILMDQRHKNAFESTSFIFLLEDENGTEFYCNLLGASYIGVKHIENLKRQCISKYVRRGSFAPETEPIYKIRDVVVREFYNEETWPKKIDHYIAFKAENLTTGELEYIGVCEERGRWGISCYHEMFPKSYETTEDGIIIFSNIK